MQKVGLLFFSFMIVLLVTGCNDLSEQNVKTSFRQGELATIDYYVLKLNQVTDQDDLLSAEFSITNKDSETHVIEQDNFSCLSGDQLNYLVPVNNLSVSIEPNQTQTVRVLCESVEEDGEVGILFYSKVVTNNIKFQIN